MNKLIPFDRDKYNKGYRAVRRDGKEILAIFFDGVDHENIFQIYRAETHCLASCSNSVNGRYGINLDDENDLLLEVKTIHLWIGLDDQFIGFPNGKVGIRCTTYGYLRESDLDGDTVKRKVKVILDAETLEQVL